MGDSNTIIPIIEPNLSAGEEEIIVDEKITEEVTTCEIMQEETIQNGEEVFLAEKEVATETEEHCEAVLADSILKEISKISEELSAIKKKMEAMDMANRELAEEARRSNNGNIRTNDRLHSENQKLKDDMYSKMLKPVLMGVCQVANNIDKDIRKEKEEYTKQRLIDIRDDVVDVCLSNLGVEVYVPEIGEVFDEMRHRLVKSIPTEDAGRHRCIQEVLGQGYLWRKNSEIIVLEPCKVNVFNANYNN